MKNTQCSCVKYSCDHRALVSSLHCRHLIFLEALSLFCDAVALISLCLWRARSSKRTRGEGTGTRAVQPSLLRSPSFPLLNLFFLY